ncbi:Ig-like domain-containing protein [bacterium]|nr:Ig-like domain-containing protein [bacterium]
MKTNISHPIWGLMFFLLMLLPGCGDSSVVSSDSYVDPTSPTIVQTSPENGSGMISGGSISITFSESMDASTIIVNTSDDQCTGTIQISNNGFLNCVKMSATPTVDSDNTIFTLQPAQALERDTTYTIRFSDEITDIAANKIVLDQTDNSSFSILYAERIYAGSIYSYAILNDKSVYYWGEDPVYLFLQYENEGYTYEHRFYTQPHKLDSFSGVNDISFGQSHICASLDNGKVNCMGWGGFGQLGNGYKEFSIIPVIVFGITESYQLSGLSLSTCSLDNNGSI